MPPGRSPEGLSRAGTDAKRLTEDDPAGCRVSRGAVPPGRSPEGLSHAGTDAKRLTEQTKRDARFFNLHASRLYASSQVRGAGPAYRASGRMMRLCACCSMMWAHHPVTRLATKIGVYWSTGIPMTK